MTDGVSSLQVSCSGYILNQKDWVPTELISKQHWNQGAEAHHSLPLSFQKMPVRLLPMHEQKSTT